MPVTVAAASRGGSGGGGGGGLIITAGEIVYGTGAGVTSNPTTKTDPATRTIYFGDAAYPVLIDFGYALHLAMDSGFTGLAMAGGAPEIDMFAFNGTTAAPTDVVAGDQLFSWTAVGVLGGFPNYQYGMEFIGIADSVAGGILSSAWGLSFSQQAAIAATQTPFIFAGIEGRAHIGPIADDLNFGAGFKAEVDSTLTIEDKVGTGITSHVVRSGPNQAANDLQEWQDAMKAVLSAILSDGVFSGPAVQVAVTTVAALPAAAGREGQIRGVTDALLPVSLAAVAGGGAVHVPVYSDGTAWIVM